MYFADHAWWERHRKREDYRAFVGQRCSIQSTGSMVDDPDVHMLRNGGVSGLSARPDTINTGQNGGFQVCNISTLAGAARIVLLGYDMRYIDGKTHWHGGHPTKVPEQWYKSFIAHFRALVGCGVEVLNATPGSAIGFFPRCTIEEALS